MTQSSATNAVARSLRVTLAVATSLAVTLALSACGLAETGAVAATAATSKAEEAKQAQQAQQAQQTQARMEQKINEAYRTAADQRATADSSQQTSQ